MGTEVTTEFKLEVKELILEQLGIDDIRPEEIDNGLSLFEGDNTLVLDSVDALDIVVALENTYGVRINNKDLARTVLQTVDSITDFIVERR